MRNHHSSAWLWAFVDVLLVLTFVQSAFIFLALPQINPPAAADPTIPPPGNIAVLACWPEGNTDVDLWATAPGEPVPVGYSNKSGRVWSLLRDDMGEVNDDGPTNCESMFARATPAGEYAINVHGYSLPFGAVTVHVEIAINGRLLVSRNMELQPKQERTVLAWKMNDAGTVVSHDEVYRPLRSATK
jgi:hypothetical protein